ncbi:GNAT family N-acetyltransferase [Kribbella sp. NPDC056861]|uniref:GNAT family N-acetyltransferase n=1 Tax=Kribbella sp. NPDC056861 TaxID=3154857 RepID=UPI0034482A89
MDLAELAESAEATLISSIGEVDPGVVERLGITSRRFGRGIAISLRNDPSRFWSKAVGFGFDRPVTSELIGEVVDFYREAGTASASFHLPPAVLPADWEEIRATYGLELTGTLVRLVRDDTPIEPVETTLRVGQLDPSDTAGVRAWAELQILAFAMPDPDGLLAEMLVAFCHLRHFQPYAAWDGDRLVATGGLFVDGAMGKCVNASTLPEYRGRGAQSALIAVRVQNALAAGCKWVSTGADKPALGKRNPSLDNMQRAGFKALYERPGWTWKP